MAAAPSLDDLFNDGRSEALTRRPELTIDEGDVSEMLLYGSAAQADHVVGYAAQRFKATYLDGASGDDLTVLADDHWVVERTEAVESTGVLTFSRATAGAGAGTIFAGTVVATDRDSNGNEIQYTNDSDISYGGSETGAKTVAGTAVLTGPSGNVGAGKITRIISNIFDSTITVTNAAQFAGGADQESDEDLRERTRQRPNTLQRGTLAALEYAARTVSGIALATATDDDTTGLVFVYIGDTSGGSSPTMVSKALNAIKAYKCGGSLVQVIGAGLVTLTGIVVDLTVRPGVDKSTLVDNIKASIVARLNRLKIGESATMAQLLQAVLNVDSDSITDAAITVTLPTINPFDLVRTVIANITVNTA